MEISKKEYNTRPFISVVIPTFNREGELIECLKSIFKQDYSSCEVIVVDDASSDETVKFIKDDFRQVKILINNKRLGPPYCRNLGILAAKGEIILFLDSDTKLLNLDVFNNLAKILTANKKIGELGGEIIASKNIPNIAYGRNIQKSGLSLKIACSPEDGLKECDFLPSCNLAVRREVIFEVGGFDPYYDYGAEDKDFGFLIQKKGYQNLIKYDIAVLHKTNQGKRQDDTLKINPYRMWSRKTLRFLIKYRFFKRIICLMGDDFKYLIKQFILCRRLKSLLWALLWLLADYFWNLTHFAQTLRSKNKNFLSTIEMDKFIKSKH